MVNRAAIAGVVLVVVGAWAVSGCSEGDPAPAAEVPSYGPRPPGYVDPVTAASRQFKCLKGTEFDALEATLTTTRVGDPGRDAQEIEIGGWVVDGKPEPSLKLRRASWKSELKPMDAESKRILTDHKCPVTW
ncbi:MULTISPECIES: hypothetical protein [unclassified Streptomyces]|uniref:hypothetical protein n=1 Tax=unclassified Streptomyces TaxID=2593676 RepID=UPI00081B4F50|nr:MULTISPECIES: hypothetical protein [unclassified Streptomyces]MYQ85450.1 hypothetical protein [Streptomyces sp. SID4936]SCE05081.1 hypothetical protein GA0115234_1056211 [Streptomyces sp. DvalAA-43]